MISIFLNITKLLPMQKNRIRKDIKRAGKRVANDRLIALKSLLINLYLLYVFATNSFKVYIVVDIRSMDYEPTAGR